MTASLACFVVRLATTGENRAKFEPLRAANRVKRRLDLAPDTAGIRGKGRYTPRQGPQGRLVLSMSAHAAVKNDMLHILKALNDAA